MKTPVSFAWVIILTCSNGFGCSPKYVPVRSLPAAKTADSAFLNLPFHPLVTENDLDALINAASNARVVLLGEATHGSAEFYEWRAAITKKLITEKGFTAIATEGDWADAEKIDRFICGGPSDSAGAVAVLQQFDRWPSWLWANTEVASFITWLNHYNQQKPNPEKVSFTGTDVFSISDALDAMLQRSHDTELVKRIQNFQNCFSPFSNNERAYGKDTVCSEQADSLLSFVQRYHASNDPGKLKLLQAAAAAFDGERYLRSVNAKAGGWNIREQHIAGAILRILHAYPGARVVVWLHNSHAGIASYSGMRSYNRTSAGEILRNELGEANVFLAGFGTYSGSVTAARTWNGITETMPLAPAEPWSWEQLLHDGGNGNKYILFSETRGNVKLQNKWIYLRSIGVLYRPYERSGVSLSLPAKRYDAYIFIDHTSALHPLEVKTTNKAAEADE